MSELGYDLLCLGRVSMDLFAHEIGAPFPEIQNFDASVGGSPSNIAIGAARLGLRVALLTAVGADPVGDFILATLAREGVETRFIPRLEGRRSPLAVLGIEPPDRFPLVFYRERAADLDLGIDHLLAAPVAQSRALLLSGAALARGPVREATHLAAEIARGAGTVTYLDLDLRPSLWADPRAHGPAIRTLLPLVDVAIGTEEEFEAAGGANPPPRPGAVAIIKRGPRGATIRQREDADVDVPAVPVEIVNTVGAGDAFASALIWARTQGRSWPRAVAAAAASGAIVVGRHGCSAALPTHVELEQSLDAHPNTKERG